MNIVIVEDYPQVAKRIRRMAAEILDFEPAEIEVFSTFEKAYKYLSEYAVDLLFLDLNLGGDDGFELLKRSVAERFETIVISANTDRALEAFEYGVVDFVPKPFNRDRLAKALARLKNGKVDHQVKFLSVKKLGEVVLVPVSQIQYIKSDGNYADIHTLDGRSHLHEKSLDKLEGLLADGFIRVHKSYIVNLNQIASLHTLGAGKYEAQLKSGLIIPIGRSRWAKVSDRFKT